jgi:RNase H-fold protein (predicted Holliday junction resolvase)
MEVLKKEDVHEIALGYPLNMNGTRRANGPKAALASRKSCSRSIPPLK